MIDMMNTAPIESGIAIGHRVRCVNRFERPPLIGGGETSRTFDIDRHRCPVENHGNDRGVTREPPDGCYRHVGPGARAARARRVRTTSQSVKGDFLVARVKHRFDDVTEGVGDDRCTDGIELSAEVQAALHGGS